jgi:hypothetical protein
MSHVGITVDVSFVDATGMPRSSTRFAAIEMLVTQQTLYAAIVCQLL